MNKPAKEEMTLEGRVLYANGPRALVTVKGKYYVLLDCPGFTEGAPVTFKESDSLPMPSYLFAVATMHEPNIEEALDEIQTRWFGDWKQ